MRRLAFCLALGMPLALSLACESPRGRACKALVAAADDCDAARAWTPAKVSPGVSPVGVVAARSESAARWVRSMDKPEPALREPADALADAMERRAKAIREIASIGVYFRVTPGDFDGPTALSIRVTSEDPVAAVLPHVEVLVRRCGLGESGLLKDAPAAFPECPDLALAAKTCMTPGPGVSVHDHVVHCSAELAAVKSSDPATSSAIDALGKALSALAPELARVITPADVLFAQVKPLSEAQSAQKRADDEAARAAAKLREACNVHASR